MRTFDMQCSHDFAAEQLNLPPANMPATDEFHPVAIDATNGVALICVHDNANGTTRVVEVPAELIDAFEDVDEVQAHLERVLRAVMN